jgi:ABC-type uncharacterized transport system permease subunit
VIALAHQTAVVVYLVAAVIGWLRIGRARSGRLVEWILALGVCIHALGFVGFHQVAPPVHLDSFPAALSLIGWLVAASYLVSLGLARVQAVGAWVASAAFGFSALGEIGLRLLEPVQVPSGSAGAWPHAHVLLSTAGFSLLALASLGGLTYLIKERALKAKRGIGIELPSLESLDRVEHLGLALGFPLLTLGVITGFVWAAREQQSPWTVHAIFLLIAWAVYSIPISLRILRREHGQGPARSAVFGFLVLAVSYLGVRLLGGAS